MVLGVVFAGQTKQALVGGLVAVVVAVWLESYLIPMVVFSRID